MGSHGDVLPHNLLMLSTMQAAFVMKSVASLVCPGGLIGYIW